MRKWIQFILVLVFLNFATGGNANGIQHYDKDGIQFKYPHGWKATDASDGSIFNIAVQDSGDGFIMFTIKFSNDTEPLEDNFRRLLKKMKGIEIKGMFKPTQTRDLQDMGISHSMMTRSICGKKSKGLFARLEYQNLEFYNLVHKIWLGDTSILVRIHCPAEDWDQHAGGYKYVMSTFKYKQ
jgi:hypothetical protein